MTQYFGRKVVPSRAANINVSQEDTGLKSFEHKIRGINRFTRWFEGDNNGSGPSASLLAEVGTIFIVRGSGDLWLFEKEQGWIRVEVGHAHPNLSGYILHLDAQGQPRWVTRKTIFTYKSKCRHGS
jgi:hypothetical protein